jgi:hypothetical protein
MSYGHVSGAGGETAAERPVRPAATDGPLRIQQRMKKLGQLLVERGWITRGVLDRALAAQSAIGGRLGTCLLESNALSEQQLLEALSRQQATEGADAEALRGVPEEVYALIPERLAARRGVLPIRRLGNRLEVAMASPGDLALRDEIAFAAGKQVVPRLALEVRLAEALERYYGVECPARMGRLVDRLNRSRYLWAESGEQEVAKPEGIGELFPQAPELSGPLLPDIDLDFAAPVPPPRGRASRRAGARAAAAAATVPARREPAPEAAPGGRRTPLPPPTPRARAGRAEPPSPPAQSPPIPEIADPEAAMEAATDRDEVGRAVLAALGRHFERVALFAARSDAVGGWMGAGPGLDAGRLAAFRVSYRQPSVFLNLRHGSGLHLGPLPPMPAHRELARIWHDEPPYSCFLLPVVIRGRLAAVLYGDRNGSPLGDLDLAAMRRLGAAAAAALERCIMLKKQSQA